MIETVPENMYLKTEVAPNKRARTYPSMLQEPVVKMTILTIH
jgi:hypothetical protein